VRVLAAVHESDAGAGVFGDFAIWVPTREPPPTDGFDALMIFGSSAHPDQDDKHPWLPREKAFIREQLELGTPILGVCLGSQLLAEAAGAAPFRMPEAEIGWLDVEVTEAGAADPVIGPLAPSTELFAWHHYAAPVPPGGIELARSDACVQAFRVDGKPAWGLQFHSEVTRDQLWGWLDGWENAEAAQTDYDPEVIRTASELRIEEQNAVGRGIAERFLAEAARGL
jgi:GMP synthase-like glutamine amidotransferase